FLFKNYIRVIFSVTFYNILPLHLFAGHLIYAFISYTGVIILIEHVKIQLSLFTARVHFDGDTYESKTNGTVPDRPHISCFWLILYKIPDFLPLSRRISIVLTATLVFEQVFG